MSDNRDRGIEFGDLAEDLSEETYPMTKAELLERYGDRELEHASGTVELSEVLPEEGEREYGDIGDVQDSVLNMIGEAAVGREGYSDRGAGIAEQDGNGDEESF